MSFLMNSGGGNNPITVYRGLDIQTSSQGVGIPLVWGRNMVAGNLIWYGDFQSQQQSVGGKGGLFGGSGKEWYYYCSFILGICQGPLGDNPIMWLWVGQTAQTLQVAGVSLVRKGTYQQTPWGYATSKKSAGPPVALPYSYLCYLGFENYCLGNSAQVPMFMAVVNGLIQDAPNGVDAQVFSVIHDALTHPVYGLGFPAARLDACSEFIAYCICNGIYVSPVIQDQSAAADTLSKLVEYTNSEYVWDAHKLTIVPYGDTDLSANGATYTAPGPVFNFTDDDYIYEDGDDPVQCTRKRPADAYNSVRMEYLMRNMPGVLEYNASNINTPQESGQYESGGEAFPPMIAWAFDQGAIEAYGNRPEQICQAHFFCLEEYALQAAQLRLQRLRIMNTYKFNVGWKNIQYNPMDIGTISDYKLGLNQLWVRIKEIEENDNGDLTFTVEEYWGTTGTAVMAAGSGSNPNVPNVNADPGECNPPAIFEPPGLLVNGLEIWGAVSGGVNWGGCDVWVSTDDITYKQIGSITGSARQGVLLAELPFSTTQTDTTDTLAVDLTESEGTLNSGTALDLQLLNTLCWCDGEWLAYQDALLVNPNQYDLSTLSRGAYGSPMATHAAGAQFAYCDDQIFRYPYAASLIGSPLYFKFVGRNLYGSSTLEDLASVPSYNYTPQGLGYNEPLANPTNLAFSYYAGQARLTWSGITDWRNVDYEIRYIATSTDSSGYSWLMARYLDRVTATQCPYWGDGVYFVAAHFKTPSGEDIYSTTPISLFVNGGIIHGSTVVQIWDEQATGWTGTLTNLTNVSGNIQLDGSVNQTGSYEIPAGHIINLGAVKPALVIIQYEVEGVAINNDVLSMANVLTVADMLGQVPGPNFNLTPQIQVSQDGTTWGPWQNYMPGQYVGMAFNVRLLFYAYDNNTYTVCTGFTFEVDI